MQIAMGRLESGSSALEKAVANLADRLVPILGHERPTEAEREMDEPGHSPLADAIRGQATIVWTQVERLNRLTERLDI